MLLAAFVTKDWDEVSRKIKERNHDTASASDAVAVESGSVKSPVSMPGDFSVGTDVENGIGGHMVEHSQPEHVVRL